MAEATSRIQNANKLISEYKAKQAQEAQASQNVAQQNSLSGSIFAATNEIGNYAAYGTQVALAPVSMATGVLGGVLSGIFSALSPIFGLLGGILSPFTNALSAQQPQNPQNPQNPQAPSQQGGSSNPPESVTKPQGTNVFKTGSNEKLREVQRVYDDTTKQDITLDTNGYENVFVCVGAAVEEANEAVKDIKNADNIKDITKYRAEKVEALMKDISAQEKLLEQVEENYPDKTDVHNDIRTAIEFLKGQLEIVQNFAGKDAKALAFDLYNDAKDKAKDYTQENAPKLSAEEIANRAESVKNFNKFLDEQEAKTSVEVLTSTKKKDGTNANNGQKAGAGSTTGTSSAQPPKHTTTAQSTGAGNQETPEVQVTQTDMINVLIEKAMPDNPKINKLEEYDLNGLKNLLKDPNLSPEEQKLVEARIEKLTVEENRRKEIAHIAETYPPTELIKKIDEAENAKDPKDNLSHKERIAKAEQNFKQAQTNYEISKLQAAKNTIISSNGYKQNDATAVAAVKSLDEQIEKLQNPEKEAGQS